MLTEIDSPLFAIKINGQTLVNNIPSRRIAEATLFNLPPAQRDVAEIVVVTADGRSMLLG